VPAVRATRARLKWRYWPVDIRQKANIILF
jgi:hypothetical protein